MEFIVKEVMLHGGKKVYIFEVVNVSKQLRFIDPIEYTKVILANSDGFEFMRNLFIISATYKQENSIFYIKDNSQAYEGFEQWWKIGRFHLDMVIFNYCNTRLSSKEISRAIEISRKTLGYKRDINVPKINLQRPVWLIEKRLCTKIFKKNFIVCGNGDVLLELANSTDRFVGLEDNLEYNMNYHTHQDMIGTKKYNGLDFFYFYEK